jgi:integrase
MRSGKWCAPGFVESNTRTLTLLPKTRSGYESILERHLLPRWRTVPVGRIDRSAVKAWVAELVAAGVGAGTIKNIVNTLKAVLSSAVEGGALKVNPRTGVKLPRPEREEMVFLTATQVLELAEAIGAEYRTLVLFAAYTWMRAGEIAALRWERVDLLRSTVDVVES